MVLFWLQDKSEALSVAVSISILIRYCLSCQGKHEHRTALTKEGLVCVAMIRFGNELRNELHDTKTSDN